MSSDRFLKFWIAQNASVFSIAITSFVLPIVAVVLLDASATEVSLLFVFQELAVISLSLVVGVWLDRLPIVRTVIFAHVIQCLLLAAGSYLLWSTPSLLALYCLALALGATKLIQEVGYTTLLPGLVQRERLVSGNSRILLANAGIGSIAPALGGGIIKITSPALALLGALIASLTAILSLLRLSEIDTANKSADPQQKHFGREIKEGMRALFQNALLRPMTISSCAGALAVGIHTSLLIIMLSRELGLDALLVGIIVSLGSVAMAAGSLLSPTISRMIGLGRSVILGNTLTAIGFGLFALASVVKEPWLAILALFTSGLGTSFYVVNQTSIRQSVTPPELMARVHASRRFVVFSFFPIGSLTGGLVADSYGVPTSLVLACGFMTLAALITLRSPLRQPALRFN